MESTIKNYKILRVLNQGARATVYKALDPGSQRTLVIKVLVGVCEKQPWVEKFNREASILSQLRHPNLVEICDHGTEKGLVFYVMEFLEGESLKERIKNRGPFPVNECLDIILEAGKAIDALHQAGMIHGGIRPANIMVTNFGRIKLMDADLGLILSCPDISSEVARIEYISPEQIYGQSADERSDIYSLGVTMYAMLAGQPPFVGENAQAILMKHKNENPPALRERNPAVPPELERIILKAMNKNLSFRHQKIYEFSDDIKQMRGQQQPVRSSFFADSGLAEEIVVDKKAVPFEYAQKKKSVFPTMMFLIVLIAFAVFAFMKREPLADTLLGWWDQAVEMMPGQDRHQAHSGLDDTQRAEQHYRAGQKYFYQGDYAAAIKEHKRAIRLRKAHAAYYKGLALAQERSGNLQAAIGTLQDMLKVDSSTADYARVHISRLKGF